MANKGKYYESQFEEATIALLREAHWQYTFGDDIHRKYTDPLIEEDLRNFLYFFDLIVQSLVVSMRFDITDNSQGNREFRSFHIDEHPMQERIGIMCIVNQDIFFSDTVFTDFDHFQLT